MENYTLLLGEEAPIPVPEVSPELGRILDRSPGEITRALRDRPWILAEDVPADRLDEAFEVFARARVKARAIPSIHMPVLPKPLRLRAVDVMPKGLFLEAAEPPAPPFLPFADLWIVSGGNVTVAPEEAPHLTGFDDLGGPVGTDLRLRGPTPGSAPLTSGRKKAQNYLLVDFVFRGQADWRLRMDAGDFSYDFLKEEMKPSSRENLKALLLRVREGAPQALFTDRTLAFLTGEPSTSYRFRSLAAFETHNRWIRQAAEEEEESAPPA